MRGALLVAGTHSDAGKSVVAAGICRWLARQGVRVAPFKAQNMALNSVVTRDGAEIGRAQAVQAAAAGLEPEAAMNPILIKPSGQRHSQVIVMGQPYGDADARSYQELKHELRPVGRERAGRPARALRRRRLRGRGQSRRDQPARGRPDQHVARPARRAYRRSWSPTSTAAASSRRSFGTLALLSAEDQARVAGFVINKFRGDNTILAPGLDAAAASAPAARRSASSPTSTTCGIDVEDSLALDGPARRRRRAPATRWTSR